ncbi:unnamed protein product, partial [marine sediment metagenome]
RKKTPRTYSPFDQKDFLYRLNSLLNIAKVYYLDFLRKCL